MPINQAEIAHAWNLKDALDNHGSCEHHREDASKAGGHWHQCIAQGMPPQCTSGAATFCIDCPDVVAVDLLQQ